MRYSITNHKFLDNYLNNIYRTVAALNFVMIFSFLAVVFHFTADDAYLTARYAKNLVNHGQFVYNLGTHTTALTAPLHPFIEAVIFFITGDIILPYKIFSTILIGLVLLSFGVSFDRYSFLVPFTLIASSPFVILWAVGGLETPVFATLLLLSTSGYLRFIDDDRNVNRYFVAVLFGLTFLSRLDSAIYLLPLGLHMCYIMYQKSGSRQTILLFGSLGTIPTVWATFSHIYYGHIFPTSSKVKPVFDNILSSGGPILLDFLLYSGIGITLLSLLMYVFSKEGPSLQRVIEISVKWKITFLSIGAYFIIFGYFAGGVHMMFSYRFFYSLLFIMALFFGHIFRELEEIKTENGIHIRQIAVIVSVLILALNVTSFGVMMTMTLNPVRGGEYQNVDVNEYNNEFMNELEPGIKAIEQHWATQDTVDGKMRVRSGLQYPAYRLDQAYVLNGLGSYYELQSLEQPGWKYTDYVIRHSHTSSAESNIATLKSEGLKLLWSKNTSFEDTPYTIYIMYNPDPEIEQFQLNSVDNQTHGQRNNLFVKIQYDQKY